MGKIFRNPGYPKLAITAQNSQIGYYEFLGITVTPQIGVKCYILMYFKVNNNGGDIQAPWAVFGHLWVPRVPINFPNGYLTIQTKNLDKKFGQIIRTKNLDK